MHFKISSVLGLSSFLVLAACGGAPPPAEAPPEAPPPTETVAEPAPVPAEPEEAPPRETSKSSGVEPDFKPGMSVNEAITAVPQGGDRINVDQEVLSEPLLKHELYEPCMKGNEHFSLKLAVWNGRVVGIDITTKPKNEKLATCLREQLEKVTYKDKARSLNTVEFSM